MKRINLKSFLLSTSILAATFLSGNAQAESSQVAPAQNSVQQPLVDNFFTAITESPLAKAIHDAIFGKHEAGKPAVIHAPKEIAHVATASSKSKHFKHGAVSKKTNGSAEVKLAILPSQDGKIAFVTDKLLSADPVHDASTTQNPTLFDPATGTIEHGRYRMGNTLGTVDGDWHNPTIYVIKGNMSPEQFAAAVMPAVDRDIHTLADKKHFALDTTAQPVSAPAAALTPAQKFQTVDAPHAVDGFRTDVANVEATRARALANVIGARNNDALTTKDGVPTTVTNAEPVKPIIAAPAATQINPQSPLPLPVGVLNKPAAAAPVAETAQEKAEADGKALRAYAERMKSQHVSEAQPAAETDQHRSEATPTQAQPEKTVLGSLSDGLESHYKIIEDGMQVIVDQIRTAKNYLQAEATALLPTTSADVPASVEVNDVPLKTIGQRLFGQPIAAKDIMPQVTADISAPIPEDADAPHIVKSVEIKGHTIDVTPAPQVKATAPEAAPTATKQRVSENLPQPTQTATNSCTASDSNEGLKAIDAQMHAMKRYAKIQATASSALAYAPQTTVEKLRDIQIKALCAHIVSKLDSVKQLAPSDTLRSDDVAAATDLTKIAQKGGQVIANITAKVEGPEAAKTAFNSSETEAKIVAALKRESRKSKRIAMLLKARENSRTHVTSSEPPRPSKVRNSQIDSTSRNIPG